MSQNSLVVQTVKNLPALQETWVWSLDQENPLEKGMATHSSIFAWRIPWTEEPGEATACGVSRVGHNWGTDSLTFKINCLCKSSDLETAFNPSVISFIAVNLLSQLWLSFFFLTWLQRKVEKGQSMKLHRDGTERIKTQQKFSLCW